MSKGKEALDRLLASEAKAELLVLFRKNPGLVDTLDGIARRTGRTAPAIEQEVGDLVKLGILTTKRVGKGDVILLDHAGDSEIQDLIAKYLGSLK